MSNITNVLKKIAESVGINPEKYDLSETDRMMSDIDLKMKSIINEGVCEMLIEKSKARIPDVPTPKGPLGNDRGIE